MTKRATVAMQERIQYIHRVTGIKNDVIKSVLNANYLAEMTAIAEGKGVIAGSYYTIYPDYRKPRNSYNPIKDEYKQIDGHNLLKIIPYQRMREALTILDESQKDKKK